MLTKQMQQLITDHRAGMVASINENATPSVSPKATFVILDDKTLAYGNIRSPGTMTNLRRNPAIEVCFIDVLTRQAVRATGKAEMVAKAKASAELLTAFQAEWDEYLPHMSAFVVISLTKAEFIMSPGYDVGHTEGELRAANLAKLQALS